MNFGGFIIYVSVIYTFFKALGDCSTTLVICGFVVIWAVECFAASHLLI